VHDVRRLPCFDLSKHSDERIRLDWLPTNEAAGGECYIILRPT